MLTHQWLGSRGRNRQYQAYPRTGITSRQRRLVVILLTRDPGQCWRGEREREREREREGEGERERERERGISS